METTMIGEDEQPILRISHLQAIGPDNDTTIARNLRSSISPEHWVGPLTTLNVLVGANNNGKSRLLRSTFSPWPLSKPAFFSGSIASAEWIDLIRLFRRPSDLPNEIQAIANAASANALHTLQSLEPGNDSAFNQEAIRHANDWAWQCVGSHVYLEMTTERRRQVAARLAEPRRATFNKLVDLNMTSTTFVYVPALRSVRPRESGWNPSDELGEICRSHYFRRIEQLGPHRLSSSEVCILSGQVFYSRMRQHLLGTLAERKMMQDFQDHLSECYFQGQQVAIIPKEKSEAEHSDHTLHIKIGQEKEQPVHLLGDGVGQLLILLYPLFAYSEKNLVLLIEEPELFLHPGFQRQLIRSYTESKRNGGVAHHRCGSRQVVVATHSPCFIDATLESDKISIFHVRKHFDQLDQEELHPVVLFERRSGADKPLLRELGVRNSSVLLTNCTIWVEGPSDRMYLSHFLRLYAQRKDGASVSFRAREDIDYTIAMYAGSNLGHWYFGGDNEGPPEGAEASGSVLVDRLCGEPMVIADKDDTDAEPTSEKARRLAELRTRLKERFYVLAVRELENLLTPESLKAALRLWHRNAIRDEDFQEFDHSNYMNEYLGSFLRDKVLQPSFRLRKMLWRAQSTTSSVGNSTVAYKTEFAKCAVDSITDYEQLSSDAKALTEAVVAHIQKNR